MFTLPGGNEDSDLWATLYPEDEGGPALGSTWVPTDDERAAIAAGANIELVIWGTAPPPVVLRLTDTPLGRGPATL